MVILTSVSLASLFLLVSLLLLMLLLMLDLLFFGSEPLLFPSQTSCSSPPEVKMVILNAPLRGLLGLVAVSTPGKEAAKKSRYSFAILLYFCQELQCSMVILTSVSLASLFLLLVSLLLLMLLLMLDLLFF